MIRVVSLFVITMAFSLLIGASATAGGIFIFHKGRKASNSANILTGLSLLIIGIISLAYLFYAFFIPVL